MAAIIYLDVDDEITSAAARIRTLEDDRIALVLPLGSRLATSRINFRLLAREAEARGKRVEVVTNDASARALAASAGLPTHLSVAAFEAGPEGAGPEGAGPEGGGPAARPPGEADGADGDAPAMPDSAATRDATVAAGGAGAAGGSAPPRHRAGPAIDDSPTVAIPVLRPPAERRAPVPQVGRRPARPRGPIIAAAVLFVALLAALGVAGFTLLPSAEIVLVPASGTLGPLELNVTAQAGVTQPDLANLLVPATRFTFDVEAADTFPATGVKVTETAAGGEVTFSSLNTGSSNTIAKGGIVKTESGIEFRTLAEITLPPAEIGIVDNKFVVIPSTGKVQIEAVTSGPSGNVAANTIVVVPKGENAQRTTVTNETATSGGAHTETLQVQQADVDAALRSLDGTLVAAFDEQIASRSQVPEGTTLFPETKSLGASTPSVDPATLVGTDADTFDLGAAAQGTVVGVDPGPVATLAEARIRSRVDAGFRLVEGSIHITPGEPVATGSVVTFPVTVAASELRIVDGPDLLARVRGLALPRARTVLGAYGRVTITVWPDWVTTIPTMEGRASLTVEAPASPSPGPGSGASLP
jgi:Baseplate J-like protein